MRAPGLGTLSCFILAATATTAQAQQQRLGTQPGDTVSILLHKVRATQRSQYDSLMQTVWWPAVTEASKKHPAYAKYVAQRRRYVSPKMASDSTYTYVYLYFGEVELPEPKDGGNRVLRLAGLSKAQSDSFAKALRSYAELTSSGILVDEPDR